MTKTTNNVWLILVAALALTACSRRESGRTADNADSLYQSAMADYAAGRLDAAIAAFEKVVRRDCANASARFQLATLLQDHRKDYLAALSLYREYLLQRPSSDKATLAQERSALCEQRFARALLLKNGGTNVVSVAEINNLRAALDARTRENAQLKASLDKVTGERDAQTRECERLRKMVSAVGAGESTARPTIVTDKDLLDDDGADGVDRVKLSADLKNLIAEEKSERAVSPLPTGEKKKDVSRAAPARETPLEKKPETYVVQEGDTLSKIAIRFYGRRSAWRTVRDANKAVISTDGRVNAGQTIILP